MVKKILLLLLLTFTTTFSLVGCSKEESINMVSDVAGKSSQPYSSKNLQEVKDLLKSYGDSSDLTVEEGSKKGMIVIENEEITANEELWTNFYENSQNQKNGNVTILKFTAHNDPVVTYLSYKDNEFFMVEDQSRDRYREDDVEDYYQSTFKYMKLFEENEKTYVYLLNDEKVTLEELNYSLMSTNIEEWIPYGFAFYYK